MVFSNFDINNLKLVWLRLQNKWQWYQRKNGSTVGTLQAVSSLNGSGTDIVPLDSAVVRVTPDTEQRGILFNEFVENSKEGQTVRPAEFYKTAPDSILLSDKKFPKSHIHLYCGIEDGHFKTDKIENFKDSTIVIPVRNLKNGSLDPITGFQLFDGEDPTEIGKRREELRAEQHDLLTKHGPEGFNADLPFYAYDPTRAARDGLQDVRHVKIIGHNTKYNGHNDLYKEKTIELTDEELENLSKRLSIHRDGFVTDSVGMWRKAHPGPQDLFEFASVPHTDAEWRLYYKEVEEYDRDYTNYIQLFSRRVDEAYNKAMMPLFETVHKGRGTELGDPSYDTWSFNQMKRPLTEEELYYYDHYVHPDAKKDEKKVKTPVALNWRHFWDTPSDSIPQNLLWLNPRDIDKFKTEQATTVGDDVASEIYLHRSWPADVYGTYDKIYNYLNPEGWAYTNTWGEKYKPSVDSLQNLINDIDKKVGKTKGIYVKTASGKLMPVSQYDASILDKKIILGNPTGGLFVGNFNNLSNELMNNTINPYLQEHPSWLVMPDMGSYSLYWLLNAIDPSVQDHIKGYHYDMNRRPTYGEYQHLFREEEAKAPYNPNIHYVVGVKASGGKLNYLGQFNKK